LSIVLPASPAAEGVKFSARPAKSHFDAPGTKTCRRFLGAASLAQIPAQGGFSKTAPADQAATSVFHINVL
jgi:hypothetical protein